MRRIFQGQLHHLAHAPHFALQAADVFVGDGGSAGHGLIAFDDANVSALPITTGPEGMVRTTWKFTALANVGTRTTQRAITGHPQDLQGCGRERWWRARPPPKWRKAYGHGLLTVDARHCNLLLRIPRRSCCGRVPSIWIMLHDRLRKLQRDRQPWRCR